MSQDGLPEWSKRTKMAITNDFENMHLDLFLKCFLEHKASQEAHKTAKKPPKTAQDSLQEPQKKVNVLIDFV